MANQEHVDILNQGVEVWNKWRKDNPLVEANLSEAKLTYAHLMEANLSGADLRGANLSGADLRRAYLRGAHR